MVADIPSPTHSPGTARCKASLGNLGHCPEVMSSMNRAHMFRTTVLRRVAPVALVAASALVLASCGSDSKDTKSSDDPSASSSTSSDASRRAPEGPAASGWDGADGVERMTRFELATSTLGRSRSTS